MQAAAWGPAAAGARRGCAPQIGAHPPSPTLPPRPAPTRPPQEAQRAWAKRRIALLQQREDAQRAASPSGWAFWGGAAPGRYTDSRDTGSGAGSDGAGSAGAGAGGRAGGEGRRIADLAAAAARAARMWQRHKEDGAGGPAGLLGE
jgi:hypothetical protein